MVKIEKNTQVHNFWKTFFIGCIKLKDGAKHYKKLRKEKGFSLSEMLWCKTFKKYARITLTLNNIELLCHISNK